GAPSRRKASASSAGGRRRGKRPHMASSEPAQSTPSARRAPGALTTPVRRPEAPLASLLPLALLRPCLPGLWQLPAGDPRDALAVERRDGEAEAVAADQRLGRLDLEVAPVQLQREQRRVRPAGEVDERELLREVHLGQLLPLEPGLPELLE